VPRPEGKLAAPTEQLIVEERESINRNAPADDAYRDEQ
jgi:hypothetical protein